MTTSTYDDNDRILTKTVDDDTNAEDRHTVYDWDDNGTSSTTLLGETTYLATDDQGTVETITTNEYNARGRLSQSEIDEDGNQTIETTTQFDYDNQGLRVRQTRTTGGNTETREFVFDPQNPTGYAQALEEVLVDQQGARSVDKAFTVGLDVISQALANAVTGLAAKEPGTFIYDAHGSVRQIADELGAAVQIALREVGGAGTTKIDYEAYGEAINAAISTAITQLLYSGEFTDALTNQQYLRARYYDISSGRFTRVDPFAGSSHAPQSFNKYLYGHSDPVTFTDPSGKFIFLLGFLAGLVAGAGAAILFHAIRSASAMFTPRNSFVPVQASKLELNYQAIRIRGSAWSADEMFNEMRQLSALNLYPVNASADITGVGDITSFDFIQWGEGIYGPTAGTFREIGQGDFRVKATVFDPGERRFAVGTLGGHPLAGWRHWQVKRLNDGDLLLETFSLTHPATDINRYGLDYAGGNRAMKLTWKNMFNDLARQSGGTVVPGGTVLDGEDRAVTPEYVRLLEGR